MNTEAFLTTHQLLAARSYHVDNINLLNRESGSWDATTKARGEATIRNLTQQIEAIDAELHMSQRGKAGAA